MKIFRFVSALMTGAILLSDMPNPLQAHPEDDRAQLSGNAGEIRSCGDCYTKQQNNRYQGAGIPSRISGCKIKTASEARSSRSAYKRFSRCRSWSRETKRPNNLCSTIIAKPKFAPRWTRRLWFPLTHRTSRSASLLSAFSCP